MRVRHNLKSLLVVSSLALVLAYAGMSVAAENYSPFGVSTPKPVSAEKAAASAASAGYASIISLEDAAPTEEKHPFSGSETQMDELDKLEPIVEHLRVAVDAHNVINRLDGYRNIQKQYNQMVQLHNKSIEILKNSEQCNIDYLGRYFNNPVKVWSGTNMLEAPENHDLRQGLSKWAIEMFELAKSAQVSPIDAGDLAEVDSDSAAVFSKAISGGDLIEADADFDMVTDGSEATEIRDINDTHEASRKQVNTLNDKYNGVYFKEPSRQDDLEKESRKADLLTNDIGAEVALWEADYLAGNSAPSSRKGEGNPSWGSTDLGGVKQRFQVWNDQRAFYTQYLDRKYKNLHKFIENYEVPADVRKRISDAVFDRQKQFMTKADVDVTAAALNAKNIARADYDQKVAEKRAKHDADVIIVNNTEIQDVNTLNNEKNGKVDAADSKIRNANSARDNYATAISDINASNSRMLSENNDLQREIAQAEFMLEGKDLTAEQQEEYSKIKSDAQADINRTLAAINEANKEKANIEKLFNEQTDIISATNQEKTDITDDYALKVNNVQTTAQNDRDGLSTVLAADVQKLTDELTAKNQKIDAAEAAAKAALGSKSMITAQQIVSTTNLIIGVTKEDAYINIDATLAAMKALGDDLYRGNMQNMVSGYHQALFESLMGKDSASGSLSLKGVGAKVHDITNFLTDIVGGSILDASMQEMYISDYRNKVKNTTLLMSIPIFDKVLKDASSAVDTKYFVGSQPKLEDFRAPMTMPDFNLPPLREYVRLDYIDLQNIGKDAQKMYIGANKSFSETVLGQIIQKMFWEQSDAIAVSVVDKEKFLNYGGRIPEIWKLMLKDKAFVESDFYLTQSMAPEDLEIPANPLQLGSEMSPLYRGGIYPCVIKNVGDAKGCKGGGVEDGTGIVDVATVSKNDSEYTMGLGFVTGNRRTELLSQSLPICQEITASCKTSFGKLGSISVPHISLLNKDDEGSPTKGDFISSGAYSELGSIFGVYSGKMASGNVMVKNILAFTPQMQSVINYGVRMEARGKDDNAPELTPAEKKNDDIYVRAQYNVNQVSDFLDHVEIEQGYRQSLEELQDTMTEMKDDLYATLRGFGFEPSPEFDISKKTDFDLAVNKLKSIKQSNMNIAKAGISSIETANSDLLYQSKNNYSRIYNGLATDQNAVTSMTMDVDNPTEFAEDVKIGATNNQVSDLYEKNADDSFEDQMKAFKPAYCAVY